MNVVLASSLIENSGLVRDDLIRKNIAPGAILIFACWTMLLGSQSILVCYFTRDTSSTHTLASVVLPPRFLKTSGVFHIFSDMRLVPPCCRSREAKRVKFKNVKRVLGFVCQVVVLVITPTKPAKSRPVRRVKSPAGKPDEFFEQIKEELGAGYTVNDRPYLPDMGEPPDKQF